MPVAGPRTLGFVRPVHADTHVLDLAVFALPSRLADALVPVVPSLEAFTVAMAQNALLVLRAVGVRAVMFAPASMAMARRLALKVLAAMAVLGTRAYLAAQPHFATGSCRKLLLAVVSGELLVVDEFLLLLP